MSSENNINNDTDEEFCIEHQQVFLEFKMALVGVIGASIALLSFVENIILFCAFTSSSALRRRNFTYLTFISLCDIFISLSYIGIMSVQIYADYFQSIALFILWHQYLRLAFTVSHITMCSASFLLIAATFERYLQTIRNKWSKPLLNMLCRHRASIVFSAFFIGALFRGTVLFEIQINHDEECEGFASYSVSLTELARNRYFDGIWRFWTRKITTVFLPFIILAYCNAAIVLSLQETDRDHMVKTLILYVTVGPNAEVSRLKSRVKSATRMLMMVVSCYLMSNVIDVFIAAWEHIDSASLAQFPEFYTVASDISSLLPIAAAAARLPIYVCNDEHIKREVIAIIRWFMQKLCLFCPFFRYIYRQNAGKIIVDSFSTIDRKTSMMQVAMITRRLHSGVAGLIMARASVSISMNTARQTPAMNASNGTIENGRAYQPAKQMVTIRINDEDQREQTAIVYSWQQDI